MTSYTYFIEHDYVQTLLNFLTVLTVFEKENDSIFILRSVNALSMIYFLSEEFPLAVFYVRKPVDMGETMKRQDKVLDGF